MKPPEGAWFNPVAEFLGTAYLRNSFTKGTDQEVAFLVETFGLEPGTRVLDVGCGPGRHALALARRGISVHGVDLSPDFIDLARASAAAEDLPATFEVQDVRELAFDSEFDAVICLCQGGFGLLGGNHEEDVIGRIGRAAKPGGAVALSAFSAVFAIRWLEDGEEFNPSTGVLHELANVRNPEGQEQVFDLWTTCFTVRELSLLARTSGLEVIAIHGVQPGKYAAGTPTVDDPELLLLARRPEAL
jgi:SAM-dependent methyltransferase